MKPKPLIDRSQPDAGAEHGLEGRLYNWKFRQALDYLDGQPPEVVHLVKVLADAYGNEGWPVANAGDEPHEMDELCRGEITLISGVVVHLIGYDESAKP